MRTRAKVGFVLLVLLHAATAHAQQAWIVDIGGGGDFTSIQACILAASEGDACLVRPGTYVENLDFLGKAITVRSDLDGNPVTVDPDPAAVTVDGDLADAVVTFRTGESSGAVLRGLTLTHGAGRYFQDHPGQWYHGGGGIFCQGASPTIQACSIAWNEAEVGGGLYCREGASPILRDCTVEGNTAVRGGGVFCDLESSPWLERCRIEENVATPEGQGGGVYSHVSTPTFVNCLVTGNEAYQGGGFHASSAFSPQVFNSTIAENNAFLGGGIFSSESVMRVANSILWGNTAMASPGIFDGGATLLMTYTDVQGGYPGDGNLTADPAFIGGGDYHVDASSPCVDMGDNEAEIVPSTDLDGEPRPVDGECDSLSTVDMGVYELQSVCPILLPAEGYYGYMPGEPGGDTTHPDDVTFMFFAPAQVTPGYRIRVTYTGYDIDQENEVKILLNDEEQEYMAWTGDGSYSALPNTLDLLPEDLVPGGLNHLRFDNLHFPPEPPEPWGVGEVSWEVVRVCDPIPLPQYDAFYGNMPGYDTDHPEEVCFSFGWSDPLEPGHSLVLNYVVYDVDYEDEVEIHLNQTRLKYAPRTDNNGFSEDLVVVLPFDLVSTDQPNIVVFDNTYNPPIGYKWGVGRTFVEPTPTPCVDDDGDGYGNPGSPQCAHPADDCDDEAAGEPPACDNCDCGTEACAVCARCIHPGAREYAGDGTDANCNGIDDCATVPLGADVGLAGRVLTQLYLLAPLAALLLLRRRIRRKGFAPGGARRRPGPRTARRGGP